MNKNNNNIFNQSGEWVSQTTIIWAIYYYICMSKWLFALSPPLVILLFLVLNTPVIYQCPISKFIILITYKAISTPNDALSSNKNNWNNVWTLYYYYIWYYCQCKSPFFSFQQIVSGPLSSKFFAFRTENNNWNYRLIVKILIECGMLMTNFPTHKKEIDKKYFVHIEMCFHFFEILCGWSELGTIH